jgi:hypothetical protein
MRLSDLDQAGGTAPLDQAGAWIGRYLSVPSPHCITVIALWAAHTHATEVFYVTPRLILDSAEPESGKTRVLELLNLICRAPIFTMNTTIAALYRRLAGTPRTILLDETDAIFAPRAAANHEDLRALLNAGYKRGATVDRCQGDGKEMKVVEFPAYAPAALAGIAGNMPATITTRAVTIHMRRRAPGEEIAEFIEEDVIEEAAPIRGGAGGLDYDRRRRHAQGRPAHDAGRRTGPAGGGMAGAAGGRRCCRRAVARPGPGRVPTLRARLGPG